MGFPPGFSLGFPEAAENLRAPRRVRPGDGFDSTEELFDLAITKWRKTGCLSLGLRGEREVWTNDRHMLAAAAYFGLSGRSV